MPTPFRRDPARSTPRPEAAGEYRQMLGALRSDDLPRSRRGASRLNENTIRDRRSPSCAARTRDPRAHRHDQRLCLDIDYNPGRCIELEVERTADREILDFQQDLRKCTEGSLSGSDDTAYSEAKSWSRRMVDAPRPPGLR